MNLRSSSSSLLLVVSLSLGCAHKGEAPAAGSESEQAPGSALGPEALGPLHGYLHKLSCGEAQDERSCKLSADQERSRTDATLAGDPNTLYDVLLRVRGLVEPRRYSGGALLSPDNKWLYMGGAPDPSRANNGQAYNVYQISVSDPKQDYFLNRDTDNHLGSGYGPSHTTFEVDYVIPLKARGGATVSVITDDEAGSGMINNADKTVVEGVPAELLPQPWDGQFFYLEVESITPAGG